jgi:CRISPR-associated protein Cas1
MYLTQCGDEIEKFFNIPEKNTAFILLGKGTSITDAAARKLAESNVMVGFCGSGGSPLFGIVDMAFLTPQSEYRPTQYMQKWIDIWRDDARRLDIGKRLLRERLEYTNRKWQTNTSLQERGISIPSAVSDRFKSEIESAINAAQLLSAEGMWAKALYAMLAKGYGVSFTRNEGEGKSETIAERANGFLDHGNYIAYGFAATALCGLGISFSLPILHGKTRRGALVFDIADLIKDAYVMPQAFLSAKKAEDEGDFRASLIEGFQGGQVLDYLFSFVSDITDNTQ